MGAKGNNLKGKSGKYKYASTKRRTNKGTAGPFMDDRAQVSIEYLIIVAISLVIAAILILFMGNMFTLKDGIKGNIQALRSKFLQVV